VGLLSFRPKGKLPNKNDLYAAPSFERARHTVSEVICIRKIKEMLRSFRSGKEGTPLRLPGLRIIKTSLTVFLCLLFYSLVPLPENFKVVTALIAAIISLRSTIKESFLVSFARIQSTLVGAVFGYLALLFKAKVGWEDSSLVYALFLSAAVVLLIWFSVSFLKETTGAGLGAIVFLAIALGLTEGVSPHQLAIARFTDTVIGIVIALMINRLLPFPVTGEKEEE
jgi:uncharacterized membrane protein YgaE (UPF0421/DUF939 family)